MVMRNRATVLAAGFLVVGVISTVGAEASAFDRRLANMELLQDRAVQAELKVSEAQRGRLNQHADWFNEELKKMDEARQSAGRQGPPTEAEQKRFADLQKRLRDRVLGELSSAQLRRLREISLQAAGFPAMMDPEVAKRVGLTKAQLDRIRKGFEELAKRAAEAQEKAVRPVFEKYKDEKPENQEAAQALQQKVQRESAEAVQRIAPDLQKMRDEWLNLVKRTVKARQINVFEGLMGRPFRPQG